MGLGFTGPKISEIKSSRFSSSVVHLLTNMLLRDFIIPQSVENLPAMQESGV